MKKLLARSFSLLPIVSWSLLAFSAPAKPADKDSTNVLSLILAAIDKKQFHLDLPLFSGTIPFDGKSMEVNELVAMLYGPFYEKTTDIKLPLAGTSEDATVKDILPSLTLAIKGKAIGISIVKDSKLNQLNGRLWFYEAKGNSSDSTVVNLKISSPSFNYKELVFKGADFTLPLDEATSKTGTLTAKSVLYALIKCSAQYQTPGPAGKVIYKDVQKCEFKIYDDRLDVDYNEGATLGVNVP